MIQICFYIIWLYLCFKKEPINFLLEKAYWEAIKTQAKSEGVSASELCRRWIIKGLNQSEGWDDEPLDETSDIKKSDFRLLQLEVRRLGKDNKNLTGFIRKIQLTLREAGHEV